MNTYYLMHKNIIICVLSIADNGDVTIGQKRHSYLDHMPVGTQLNDSKFSEWWKNRCLPANREGIQKALKANGYNSAQIALVNTLALSLTDCYWIRPRNSDIKWEDVNFFENDFIDSIGESLFQTNKLTRSKSRKIASSSGELKKKWLIENGHRMLVKGNSGKSYQQSLNEVFVANIHRKLNPKYHLEYTISKISIDSQKQIIGCKSECFCNTKCEFVSASDIVDNRKLLGSDNPLNSFKNGCLEMGMEETTFNKYMDYLILTDFLFTNIDRHLNNLGVLRNPDTLELIGFSPIFDSGNSMFYNLSLEELKKVDIHNIKTNSFFNNETKMLKHVKDFNVIDLNKIKPDFSIYNLDVAEEQPRYEIIQKLFNQKLELLKKYQKEYNSRRN